MDIKILIAAHKKSVFPNDSIYYPLQVGAIGKDSFGIARDDAGLNISNKNFYFNEVTGIFWAWKNLECDYVGLNHYRRYFTKKNIFERIINNDKYSLILSREDAEELLQKTDIILPEKRKYYIETIESHYLHLPYTIDDDLAVLCDVVKDLHEDYYDSLHLVLNRRWAHMFNMFIMKKNYFNEFCEWAFSVLFEVDNRIKMEGRKKEEARMYISEFLIDTWIEKNQYRYEETGVINVEGDNVLKKGIVLMGRKMRAMLRRQVK